MKHKKKIGRLEFLKLFGCTTSEDLPFPGLAVLPSGIWLEIFQNNDGTVMTPTKRTQYFDRLRFICDESAFQVLESRPIEGKASSPLLRFPCTEKKLAGFIKWASDEGFFDKDAPDTPDQVRNIIISVEQEAMNVVGKQNDTIGNTMTRERRDPIAVEIFDTLKSGIPLHVDSIWQELIKKASSESNVLRLEESDTGLVIVWRGYNGKLGRLRKQGLADRLKRAKKKAKGAA